MVELEPEAWVGDVIDDLGTPGAALLLLPFPFPGAGAGRLLVPFLVVCPGTPGGSRLIFSPASSRTLERSSSLLFLSASFSTFSDWLVSPFFTFLGSDVEMEVGRAVERVGLEEVDTLRLGAEVSVSDSDPPSADQYDNIESPDEDDSYPSPSSDAYEFTVDDRGRASRPVPIGREVGESGESDTPDAGRWAPSRGV